MIRIINRQINIFFSSSAWTYHRQLSRKCVISEVRKIAEFEETCVPEIWLWIPPQYLYRHKHDLCVCRNILLHWGLTLIHVGIAVLTAVTVKSEVFWILLQFSLDRARYFRGLHRLHLQGRRVRHLRNQSRGRKLSHLMLEPGNADGRFFRNVWLTPRYMAPQLRRHLSWISLSESASI
jgi:hypothetical protein